MHQRPDPNGRRLRGACSHVVMTLAVGVAFAAGQVDRPEPPPVVDTARTTPPTRTAPLTRLPSLISVPLAAALGAGQDPASGSSVDDVTFVQHMQDETEDAAETFWDRWSLDATVDWASAYYFRGLLQERNGLILQPALELGYDLTAPDSDLGVALYAGVWASLHSAATDAETTSDFLQYWYEVDYFTGLSLEYGAWSFSAGYVWFTSPADAFERIDEVEMALAYDDSACWDGDFALNPQIVLAIETGPNPGTGDDLGTYLELGIAPSLPVRLLDRDVEVSMPVLVGLGLGDYFQNEVGEDDRFGYLETGLDLSTEIADNVTLYGGVHFLNLGSAATEANGGDRNAVVGTVGVSVSF